MADFVFKLSPNIILGSYATSRLGHFAKDYGSKFIVVADPVLKEVGLLDKILQSLTDRNVEFFVFSEILEGASTKTIQQALKLARDAHIHGVIAAGGIKTIQIAKAVSAYYHESHDLYTFVDGSATTTSALPMVCLPTTPRAPYIFMNLIPVVDARNLRTAVLKVQPNICKLALFDPNLTVTLTENQTASISLEILTLLIEEYLSPKSNFFSEMIVEKGVELIKSALDGAPSLTTTVPAEILLCQAGCMASLGASCSSIGTATLLAMCINAKFKISKSLISSILLPYIIEDAATFKAEKIEKLSKIFKIESADGSIESLCQAFSEDIRQRLAKANLPARLKDLTIPIEKLALASEDAASLDFVNTLPRSMTSDDLFGIIKQAY